MINQNLLLAGDDAYNIQRSLRFRSSASAYLSRTPSSTGNRKVWTWSGWIKRGSLGGTHYLMTCNAQSGNDGIAAIYFNNDQLHTYYDTSGANPYGAVGPAVYRDPSGWYHIVWSVDAANTTHSVYVNNVLVSTDTSKYPPNYDFAMNRSGYLQAMGSEAWGLTTFADLYMAEVYFIDGQALTPSSFGMNDPQTGVWEPKKYTGTYGTNGFYLNFSDNSNNTAATIGKDSSGNGNNWTPNNISVTSGSTYDSMTDVPTLTSESAANYCTFSPLEGVNSLGTNLGTFADGNLSYSVGASGGNAPRMLAFSTIHFPSSGKWYAEFTNISNRSVGLISGSVNQAGVPLTKYITVTSGGSDTNDGSVTSGATVSFTTSDVIGIAYDVSAATLKFYKNGTEFIAYGSVTTSVDYCFGSHHQSSGSSGTVIANFGQRPFAYTPPTGFKALNTFNLPTPTIGATASTQAGKYFNAITYTGNGTNGRSITGVGFQPDFIWIKSRSNAIRNNLHDAVRGTNRLLFADGNFAEFTSDSDGWVSAFNSDGFTATAGSAGLNNLNANGYTYVAWNWRAGNSTSSNTAGSITTTVSVNQAAGFSIVTYTGTGSNATIGHGLGVAPKIWFWKNRDAASDWAVNYNFLNNSMRFMFLNSTAAQADNSASYWGNAPTSTVNYIGASDANTNINGQRFVMYAFAEVAGFSRIGSYTGNGSTDGPFVFCGFRPALVIIKRTDTTGNWGMIDNKRSGYNEKSDLLYPNGSFAEDSGSTYPTDILSNGFKVRNTSFNASGGTYIFMAFAENPFKYSLAR